MSIGRRVFAAVLFACFWSIPAPHAQAPDAYSQLKFRYIGPVGNRVIAVAGVPREPNVYYVGAASGGIFKTTDNGAHWTAIFDDQPVSSIGSLAISPSDPNVVWAGTGESFIRSNISIGNGIYRSTDAGKSWMHLGLEQTGRIGRLVLDPGNPDIAFACALGHAYGPQQERGVYRTGDGGRTWQRTLFVDAEHRLLGHRHRSAQSAGALRGHVADRNPHMGSHERRARQRALQVRGRRAHVEAPDGSRVAEIAGRQDLSAGRAEQFQPRLRADRNGRRAPGRRRHADAERIALAQRRWRRALGARQLRSTAARPHALLHALRDCAGQRQRGVLSVGRVHQDARRREDEHRPLRPPGAERRQPRHVDRSHQRRPLRRRARRWAELFRQSRAQLAPGSTAGRPDVSRRGRQSDPVQRLRQPAGRTVHPRTQQQPACQTIRRRRVWPDSARHVALGRRWREWVGDSRSGRQQHRLGQWNGLWRCRRHRRALR